MALGKLFSKIFSGEPPKQDYRAALLKISDLAVQYPNHVLDTEMLPLPKSEMKKVFIDAWVNAKSADERQWAEVGYVHILSNFQDGIGEPFSLRPPLFNPNDPNSAAAAMEKMCEMLKVTQADSVVLTAEFSRFKLARESRSDR